MQINLSQTQLEFIHECIYQSVVNDNLKDFCKNQKMTDDELDEFSIALREKIASALKKSH